LEIGGNRRAYPTGPKVSGADFLTAPTSTRDRCRVTVPRESCSLCHSCPCREHCKFDDWF